MRKFHAFALASGLMLLGSCTNDVPDGFDMTPVDEEGNIGYIKFDIAGIGSETRADEKNDEEDITNVAFIFRDKNGDAFTRYIGGNYDKGNAYFVENDANHSGSKCAVVNLQKLPVSVVVIVNGPLDKNYNISNIYDSSSAVVSRYDNETHGGFYMSNATYWAGSNHVKTYRTSINPTSIAKTPEDVINGTAPAVKVNVERYVAKVEITKDAALTNSIVNGKLDPNNYTDAADKVFSDDIEVRFEPMYTCLTAKSKTTPSIKHLPEWSSTNLGNLINWSDLNKYDANKNIFYSNWVEATDPENVSYPTRNSLEASGKNFSEGIVRDYAFDNQVEDESAQTNVVVCGKYTVTNKKTNTTLAAADGSFWLVAFEDKFTVYDTEEKAIIAMGGVAGDKLVPEDVDDPSLDINKQRNWSGWTGWMRIAGKNIVTRCLKYKGGYGYYSAPLLRYWIGTGADREEYRATIRNHKYKVNIQSILGMGVGLPDEDTPIIPINPPGPKDQNYYLHMSITVLPWRDVDNDVNWK